MRAVLVVRMGSYEVVDALAQQCGGAQPGVIEVAELIERGDGALLRDAIEALELLGELVGNEIAGLTDEGRQSIAGWFVEGHDVSRFPSR